MEKAAPQAVRPPDHPRESGDGSENPNGHRPETTEILAVTQNSAFPQKHDGNAKCMNVLRRAA